MPSPEETPSPYEVARHLLEQMNTPERIRLAADGFISLLKIRGARISASAIEKLGDVNRQLLPSTIEGWMKVARIAKLPPDDVLHTLRTHHFLVEAEVKRRLQDEISS